MCVAKKKALISLAVTEKLVWASVFVYANCYFSHAAAHKIKFILACIVYYIDRSESQRILLDNKIWNFR